MSNLKHVSALCAWLLAAFFQLRGAHPDEETEREPLRGFHLVAKDDFTATGRYPWLVAGKRYQYSEAEIPTDRIAGNDSLRDIIYDAKQIELRFEDLRAQETYRLRVSYLSNSHGRILQLRADDQVLQQRLELPFGEVVRCVLELPPETYQDGAVSLTWTNLAGINVVLADMELWSSAKALQPCLDLTVEGDLQGRLVGCVRDSVGKPVAAAQIEIESADEAAALTAQANGRGEFRVSIPRIWRRYADRAIRITATSDAIQKEKSVSMDEVFLPRLTPCPVKVAGTAEAKQSLNGEWRFHPDPPDDFFKPDGEPGDGWGHIRVPGEWAMQGFTVKPHQPGGYRLKLFLPEDWKHRRVKLRFDAVYSSARVWLNGKSLGGHRGAFTPFEMDVTEAAVPGQDNLLALAVTSEGLAEDLVAGRIMVGHQMGGIIRRVSLFAAPEVNIASLHVDTTFDDDFRDATLRVTLEVANECQQDMDHIAVRFRLREALPGQQTITIKPERFAIAAVRAGETVKHTFDIPVAAPKHWNAETPNLYFLDGTLEVKGQPSQSVQRRFGFRQVEVRGHQVFLNGQPIRFRGAARQDSHPLTGRTVAEDVHRRDVELLVWANCNNAYTCAFSPDEQFLDLCDELGLYVMEEPGTCWVGMGHWNHETLDALWGNQDSDDPKFYPEYLRPVLEMIQRSRSHPSVLTWMLADESQFGSNFRKVLNQVKKLDPTRPVHFAWDPGGEIFDIGSMHYPWYQGLTEAAKSHRPVMFDQFCHIYLYRPELMTDPGLRDFWGREFAPFWEAIWNTPSMLGGQFFNFTDDVFLMPSGDVQGYGVWGVIDGWRRPRPELWHLKKTYTPVKIHQTTLPVPEPGEVIRVRVENRYDFTNLAEIRIEWALGDESGTAQANIPPQSPGTIEIPARSSVVEGQTLSIKFYRRDLMVDSYNLAIGERPTFDAAPQAVVSSEPQLAQTEEVITVSGGDFAWMFDRRTGELQEAVMGQRSVLIGGPVLMILPHKSETHTSGYPEPRPAARPFNETCHDWQVEHVSAEESEEGVQVVVEGRYREADGCFTFRIGGEGHATLHYRFVCRTDVDPRQIGVVLYLPKTCDTLRWNRRTQWTVYPENHIGRPEGVAKAFRDSRWPKIGYRDEPPWPWSLDENALGTNDFRATRRNIYRVSLADADGFGVRTRSDGRHHCRAFVDGDRIGLLVAHYSTGGAGAFLGPRRAAERRPLAVGDVVEDTVSVELFGTAD